MLTHRRPINSKQQSDHDLTELSWLTQSGLFDQSATSHENLTQYLAVEQRSSPSNLIDSSDSEHDNDSSSLNSSSERVPSADMISPPHSALCFWILFAIEDSRTRALTLNQICEWIEHHIDESTSKTPHSSDEHSLYSARLKSKIRYHMTKQISFFVKIIKNPLNGMKLRYPLWTTDRSKRLLLLDTLLTMNTRQLSLTQPYTINLFERLCSNRRRELTRQTNDENSCPYKRDNSLEEEASPLHAHSQRKKQRAKIEQTTSTRPSVEVVDAAMTLLLLRQPK